MDGHEYWMARHQQRQSSSHTKSDGFDLPSLQDIAIRAAMVIAIGAVGAALYYLRAWIGPDVLVVSLLLEVAAVFWGFAALMTLGMAAEVLLKLLFFGVAVSLVAGSIIVAAAVFALQGEALIAVSLIVAMCLWLFGKVRAALGSPNDALQFPLELIGLLGFAQSARRGMRAYWHNFKRGIAERL